MRIRCQDNQPTDKSGINNVTEFSNHVTNFWEILNARNQIFSQHPATGNLDIRL